MSILRSKEIWTVAYYLSRCGSKAIDQNSLKPPTRLEVDTWNDAYELFYSSLAQDRTLLSFQRTLKNARDQFDGYTDVGRVGWRDSTPEREPQSLTGLAGQVLNKWKDRKESDLWIEVKGFMKSTPTEIPSDLNLTAAERTEITTYRILRDTELARRIKIKHRHKCQLCGHSIQLEGGLHYAEAHHIQPLGAPHNGPDIEENIVCVCPNHHAELDYGVRRIAQSDFRKSAKHRIDERFIDYHNTVIVKK
jgi:hypothetical protein